MPTTSIGQFINALDGMSNPVELRVVIECPTAAAFFDTVTTAKSYFDEPSRMGESATHIQAHFGPALIVQVAIARIEELREERTLTDIVKQHLNEGDSTT